MNELIFINVFFQAIAKVSEWIGPLFKADELVDGDSTTTTTTTTTTSSSFEEPKKILYVDEDVTIENE